MKSAALILLALTAAWFGATARTAVAAAPSTSDTYPAAPADVVKAMLAAANAQQFDRAKSFAEALVEGEEAIRKDRGGIREYWRGLLHDFTYADLEVLGERDAGGYHLVRSLIHFTDKKTTLVTWKMKQVDGKWKVMST